jgi:hypothetical protein
LLLVGDGSRNDLQSIIKKYFKCFRGLGGKPGISF